MSQHILIRVALDHEEILPGKIALARKLLEEGGKITLLTVLENIPGFVQEFVTVDAENHLSAKIRTKLERAAGGAPDTAVDLRTGKPGVEIVAYAAEKSADLIIIGSHRPGVSDYFLGSTAARVTRRAYCPVHVQR